ASGRDRRARLGSPQTAAVVFRHRADQGHGEGAPSYPARALGHASSDAGPGRAGARAHRLFPLHTPTCGNPRRPAAAPAECLRYNPREANTFCDLRGREEERMKTATRRVIQVGVVLMGLALVAAGCGGGSADTEITGTETADIDNCSLVTDEEATS